MKSRPGTILISARTATVRACPFIAAALLITTLCAIAELPPTVYRDRQKASPEALVIKVRTVKTKETRRPDHTLIANTVEAVVENVARTATNLKSGTAITIEYTQRRHDQPIAGPSEVPSLKEGEVRPAYLAWSKEANAYAPAAGGFSFSQVQVSK